MSGVKYRKTAPGRDRAVAVEGVTCCARLLPLGNRQHISTAIGDDPARLSLVRAPADVTLHCSKVWVGGPHIGAHILVPDALAGDS